MSEGASATVVDADRFVLDTSAVVAYFANEPGADRVEHILVQAERRAATVHCSFMTYMEVLYQLWRRHGERVAKAAYLRLKALSLHRVDPAEELLIAAARIKATHELSMANAWIAATALTTGSVLVHKDPEFRALAGEVSLLELPVRPKRRTHR